ncbi:ubiquitin-2 like Rad60 SUMO-like-domain-containing protein [Phascolomyces articulosus]|uniref:Ubiquitin-2 like Rad60 SUMO-like-domain-containing protein n=1 Tax=Phascolomyces articulosus TaxID=60185 RepID=A0AAD5K5N7_9FUNG|nr:ubiquitin-2 like Rad60 SUMO-like-domain-containing protein [Phascolomyces articulosus]
MADFDICDIYSRRRPTKKKSKGKKVEGKKRKSQFEEILQTRAKLGVDGSRSDSDNDSDSDDYGGRSKKKTKLLYSELNKRLHSRQSSQEQEDSKDDSLGLCEDSTTTAANSTTDDTSFSTADANNFENSTPEVENTAQSALIELSDDDIGDMSISYSLPSSSSSASPYGSSSHQQPQKPPSRPPPVIPTIEELTDLDPDLIRLAAAASSTQPRSSALDGNSLYNSMDDIRSSTGLEKVCIKVEYVPLIKTDNEQLLKGMKFLSEPIKVILMENDPFDKLLQYFCSKKLLKKDDVILVYEGIPVMLRATPQSLNMITGVKTKNLMKAYKKDDYEKQEEEKQEMLRRRLEETPFDDNFIQSLEQTPAEPSNTESLMRIKLRSRNNEDTNMRVKQTTSLRTIVKTYVDLNKLGDGAVNKIRLSFDGEDLSLDDTIGDTELEDEDVVEVTIS